MASKMVDSMKFVPAQVIFFCSLLDFICYFSLCSEHFLLSSLDTHLWRYGTCSILRHYAKLYSFQGLAKIVLFYSFVFINHVHLCLRWLHLYRVGLGMSYRWSTNGPCPNYFELIWTHHIRPNLNEFERTNPTGHMDKTGKTIWTSSSPNI